MSTGLDLAFRDESRERVVIRRKKGGINLY
jgi:hypothetical protein